MSHGQSPKHQRKRPPRRQRTPVQDEGIATGPIRIQRLLSAGGIASRRSAEALIRERRVTVNGRTASLGDSADPAVDKVAVDGRLVSVQPPAYWLVHKPTGVITTLRDTHGRPTVVELLPRDAGRLNPVGRLDRDTSGLLLMTNDGVLADALLHPSHGSEKEYRVTARGEVLEKDFKRLQKGVHLDDGRTAPARVSRIRYDTETERTTFNLIITEGRKRQIRRAMLALGHPVKKLVRVRMGPLVLGRLAPGSARPLRPDEVRRLKAYAAGLKPAPR